MAVSWESRPNVCEDATLKRACRSAPPIVSFRIISLLSLPLWPTSSPKKRSKLSENQHGVNVSSASFAITFLAGFRTCAIRSTRVMPTASFGKQQGRRMLWFKRTWRS